MKKNTDTPNVPWSAVSRFNQPVSIAHVVMLQTKCVERDAFAIIFGLNLYQNIWYVTESRGIRVSKQTKIALRFNTSRRAYDERGQNCICQAKGFIRVQLHARLTRARFIVIIAGWMQSTVASSRVHRYYKVGALDRVME